MAIPFSTIRENQTAAVKSKAAELRKATFAAFPFHALRSALGWSQAKLAQMLGTSQTNVCRQEARTDFLMSTFDKFVSATGGRWSLRVDYPGMKIDIRRDAVLGDIVVKTAARATFESVPIPYVVPRAVSLVVLPTGDAVNDCDTPMRAAA